ncbi:hypothetical protein TNCV_912911 [Trichonephila clavipes]|nr:hypothetical protein TNCV_912911 [Trichonephila clavipes]
MISLLQLDSMCERRNIYKGTSVHVPQLPMITYTKMSTKNPEDPELAIMLTNVTKLVANLIARNPIPGGKREKSPPSKVPSSPRFVLERPAESCSWCKEQKSSALTKRKDSLCGQFLI